MVTEKRFTIEPIGIRECIVDNTSGEQLDTFDYTERLCELLNELHEENQKLKKQLKTEHTMLDNAILLERTRMGQNSLKQYKEAIQ